ncbi:tyrosinase cofactor [Streptomyces kaniharaensis]|nr:tyrosinase cofactor [Streptomyces kaniharaensis]
MAGPAVATTQGAPAASMECAGSCHRSPVFSEVYKGRAILITADDGKSSLCDHVLIDGVALSVHRLADGGYYSLVNAYQSFPTLRATAEAAVDSLGGARLLPAPCAD